jgi:hypothetical protein
MSNNLAVIKVHNNSLGSCKAVENEETGIKLVKEIAEEKLSRKLTQEEIEQIDNDLEFYNEDDIENQWCVALAEIK